MIVNCVCMSLYLLNSRMCGCEWDDVNGDVGYPALAFLRRVEVGWLVCVILKII